MIAAATRRTVGERSIPVTEPARLARMRVRSPEPRRLPSCIWPMGSRSMRSMAAVVLADKGYDADAIVEHIEAMEPKG